VTWQGRRAGGATGSRVDHAARSLPFLSPAGPPYPRRTVLHVDREDRTVTHAPGLTGLAPAVVLFLAGGALTVAVATADGLPRPLGWLGVAALVAGAGLLTRGLRHGWTLDPAGVVVATGSRRPRRLAWGDLTALEVTTADAGGSHLHARTTADVLVPLGSRPSPPDEVAEALAAALDLGIVPGHVEVPV
jgi:hypothetical protein